MSKVKQPNSPVRGDDNGMGETLPAESKSTSYNHGRGKVLIAYASQFGTTGEVAETIGNVLRDDDYVVEAKLIGSITSLGDYDAVIIGSAIQYDQWMSEATEFVRDNQNALGKVPVSFFFTCLTLSRKNQKSYRQAQAYSDKLAASFSQLNPVSIGGFAGVLNYSKIPALPRIAAKCLFAFLGVKEGDHRDWSAIRSWAENTSTKLSR